MGVDLAQIRRRLNSAGRNLNPLRELIANHERLAAQPHLRPEGIAARLPALIEDQVEQQFGRFESKIIRGFREMGQRVTEESTAAISSQLGDRIDSLEKVSALQTEALHGLRRSTTATEGRVSSAVNSIEETLSNSVPGGFRLQQAANVTRALPKSEESAELVKADRKELEESAIRYGFCPKCTSGHIRRKSRHGLFENFLRLFFIAPFICRACRHKFYKF